MSLLNSLKAVFAGKPSAPSRETGRTYLIDAEKLAESRDGRSGPVERFQAIQQLSRFAEREKVEIVVVVGGRPLREVAHGEAFNGVRVFYVEANSTMADQMQKVLDGELRGRAVVVTNDKQLEAKLAERGVSTVRVSTLRKAFEGGNGEGGEASRGRERGDRGDRGDRRSRRGPRPDRGDRQGAPMQENRPSDQGADRPADRQPDEPAPQSQPAQQQQRPSDTIDNLIDRVD